VYMVRKHSPVRSKEPFRPEQQLLFRTKIVEMAIAGLGKVRPLTGNLNLFNFISQVLRCRGVDRG
jgi:hypothetical protein